MAHTCQEHHYEVHHINTFIWNLVIWAPAGVILLAVGLLMVLDEGSADDSIVCGICAALGAFVLGDLFRWVWWVPKQPWVIEVDDTGTVTFVARRGEPRSLPVADIAQIHIGFTKNNDDDVAGQLEIHGHVWHTVQIDYFDRAQVFVEHLLALNPSIEVSGNWPPVQHAVRR